MKKAFHTRTSFIKARDPSMLTGHLVDYTEQQGKENEKLLDVYLRLKGGVEGYDKLYEIFEPNTLMSIIPDDSELARNIKHGDFVKRKYSFSRIFGPNTSQQEIFNELVKPKLLKFINGYNSTLMTYGVSGSGKTYTIIGTGQEPGALPRSLEYIFQTLPTLPPTPNIKPLPTGTGAALLTKSEIAKEVEIKQQILNFDFPGADRTKHIETYQTMQSCLLKFPAACLEDEYDVSIAVWVSHAEIYNEHIHDLLEIQKENKKSRNKLKLGNSNGCTYIKNLTYVHVSSGLEAYQVLQYGLHHLNFAKTNINDHSSRSHSIFSVVLTQKTVRGEFSVSRFHFCDLAGAERSKKTLNIGQRLKESNNINTSLLVLGRCIAGVRSNQNGTEQLVPFRESKLTQIFQKALLGHEDICMIVNINPCRKYFDETQHVLNFSAIAKKIIVVSQQKSTTNSRISLKFRDALLESKPDEEEINILKNLLTEVCISIEEEETDAQMEENVFREEFLAEHYQKFESTKHQLEIEYSEYEKTLKYEYEQKMKEAKAALKNECSDFSFSSDSSDEEIASTHRKRKATSDVETITIYSSDEEDYISLWKKKNEAMSIIIEEHHQTISALEEEIERVNEVNEELKKNISELKLVLNSRKEH